MNKMNKCMVECSASSYPLPYQHTYIYKEELGEVKGTKRELRAGLHDKVKANTPPLQGAD